MTKLESKIRKDSSARLLKNLSRKNFYSAAARKMIIKVLKSRGIYSK